MSRYTLFGSFPQPLFKEETLREKTEEYLAYYSHNYPRCMGQILGPSFGLLNISHKIDGVQFSKDCREFSVGIIPLTTTGYETQGVISSAGDQLDFLLQNNVPLRAVARCIVQEDGDLDHIITFDIIEDFKCNE